MKKGIDEINQLLVSVNKPPLFTGSDSDYKIAIKIFKEDKNDFIRVLRAFEEGRKSGIREGADFSGKSEHPLFLLKKMNDQASDLERNLDSIGDLIEKFSLVEKAFRQELDGEAAGQLKSIVESMSCVIGNLDEEYIKVNEIHQSMFGKVKELYERRGSFVGAGVQ